MRLGVTVIVKDMVTIDNLKKAIDDCPVTRSSMIIRIPDKCKPHDKLGVDPEVFPTNLISVINNRNPGLELDPSLAFVNISFRQGSGNCPHVLKVSPPDLLDFAKLMSRQKLCMGAAFFYFLLQIMAGKEWRGTSAT